jgi:hypothetical protein
MTQTPTKDVVKSPEPPRGRFPTGRRRVLLAAVAVVLVAALAVLVVVLDHGSGGDVGQAAGTSSPAPSTEVIPNPPTPTPTGPTEDATQLPPAATEVPLDAPAAAGNGVVATLTGIEAIQGTANGPGNVAGPALRVTVTIDNGTAEAITLAGAAVNMYYGADRTPASPLDDPSQQPFGIDMVQPGASAEAVYVFTVPADQRDLVTVEVGYEAGAPLLLFSGPVG